MSRALQAAAQWMVVGLRNRQCSYWIGWIAWSLVLVSVLELAFGRVVQVQGDWSCASETMEDRIAELSRMSVRELKELIVQAGASAAGCIEKDDLVRRVIEASVRARSCTPPSMAALAHSSKLDQRHKRRVVPEAEASRVSEPRSMDSNACRSITTSSPARSSWSSTATAPIATTSLRWPMPSFDEWETTSRFVWSLPSTPTCGTIADSLCACVCEQVRFVFPNAPTSLGGNSYAWWPLDLMRVISLAHSGRIAELFGETPAGLVEARTRILEWTAAVAAEAGLSLEHVVIAGFSQGGMLAVDVALHAPVSPAALVAISPAPVCEPQWRTVGTSTCDIEHTLSQARDASAPSTDRSGCELCVCVRVCSKTALA